jgi:hypothetical protein
MTLRALLHNYLTHRHTLCLHTLRGTLGRAILISEDDGPMTAEHGMTPRRQRTEQRLPTHVPLLALGILALLAAMWAGLQRLGWPLPSLGTSLAAVHGPLMVSGFLGTLIGIERAVALGRRWPFAGPLCTGVGGLLLIVGGPTGAGAALLTLGSLVLVAVCIRVIGRQPALHTITMALGAMLWLGGNSLWLAGWPVPSVVFWWAGFLVLTIAGERLEMSRLLRLSRQREALFAITGGLLLAGLVTTTIHFDGGVRLGGAGLMALALWLGRHDIARRTVRQTGLTRFIAVSLLSGYVWLGVSGLLAVLYGGVAAGPRYDAILHALFVGFVFAMIFGHAPVIFPAVLSLSGPMRATFYPPLFLLHVSLLLRVLGDVLGWWPGRQWGGLLNVVAVLLFLGMVGRLLMQGKQSPTGVA